MALIKPITIATKIALYSLPPTGGDFFPISLGYIAASLHAQGFETAIIELDTVNRKTAKETVAFIQKYKPTIVGISVYQVNIELALDIANLIKKIAPQTVIVFGGPQITFMPKEALEDMPDVDILMRGEGEVVWPRLAHAIDKNQDMNDIDGITFIDNGVIVDNDKRELIDDLDDIPSPYKNVFDLKAHSIALMLTSRGCTFNCAFCYTPRAYNRRIRAHSVKRVIDDIATCVKAKIKKFYFADPAFTFDKKRTAQIMEEIVKHGWKIDIWCETRDDLVDETLLKIMAKGGVKYIAYGLESADEKVNKILRKKIDLENFKRIIVATHAAGITPEVFTLYGLPGQDKESCLKTIKFLKSLNVNLVGNSAGQQLNLFFGTDINDNPAEYGITVDDNNYPLYFSPGIDYTTQYLKPSEIVKIARTYT
jgi:anaerobic magnesium-protoporphyrin IX monomethyl ester cyclase